jgi:hypothetical protein
MDALAFESTDTCYTVAAQAMIYLQERTFASKQILSGRVSSTCGDCEEMQSRDWVDGMYKLIE